MELINRLIIFLFVRWLELNPKIRVTLEDISSKAGVSVATVSHALSGKGRIAPATRERILQIVEELSYQPDKVAQSLARRRASEVEARRNRRGKGKYMLSSALIDRMETSEFQNIVQMELQQMDEEGYEVAQLQEKFAAQTKWTKSGLDRLYHEILSSPRRSDFGYQEPDNYDDILSLRPPGPRKHPVTFTPDSLYDRIHGGWLGRCIGCVLGKPIESGWAKNKVVQYLKLAGAYPLTNYIPRVVPLPACFELNPESDGFFLGEIEGVPYDDDIDYTILGLHLLESYGIDFSTADVATEWLGHLPYFRTYTAERFAYRNLAMSVSPGEAAITMNPAREFIGARIRADIFGFVAPGKPELAAQLAYRDAALSHTKNGVYSAMFMAAMISWSFVTPHIPELIEVGLSEIPAKSRLAEAVQKVQKIHQETDDWEIAYDSLLLQYGSYHPVHTINNTASMVLALLYSQDDFEKALCTTVTCGLDTDCNGANAGSVVGVIHGAHNIPDKWSGPLQNTAYTSISQWKERRISELARRTGRLAEQVLSSLG